MATTVAIATDLDHPSQAFRPRPSFPRGPQLSSPKSSAKLRIIPTRLDPKSGQRVILWNDIVSQFPKAERVVNGDRAILFLTNDNFEYLAPKRIPHHPGEVLDIILPAPKYDSGYGFVPSIDDMALVSLKKTSGEVEQTPSVIHSSQTSCLPTFNDDNAVQVLDHTTLITPSTTSDIISTTISTASMTTETAIVKSNSQISLRTATQRQQSQSSQIQTILTGQELQAEELMRSVRYYYERLQIEVQKSNELQERVYAKQKEAKELMLKGQEETQQWQQRIMDQQISMKKSFEEKSEKMIRMQEEALGRLALIQNRIQAVLSQTYELHEYPIPHLFIVLPKPARRRDALMNPFSNQFRLFFLCECGKHTMTENSKISHEIHLAKHEGYDIERPTEFFQKYGPYVLTMMEMIKFGFAVAGVVVPPLAHTGLVDGVEAIKGSLDIANESIGSLVDETINIINSQFANADGGMDLEDGQSRLDDVEALEGADLRQLESFLSVHDEGRVLGNLYRIVTTEGKVKWVCIDHYRENYRSATLQQIKDSLISHRAVFDEDDTKVYLTLRQKALSGDFYDNLLKMRGIQTLEIGIAWDATLNDLRQLAQIVSDANITNLKLYGNYFENSARDFFNNGRRYDPIVQLLQNRRIQSLEIADFKDFYAHVSSTPLGMAPQVRSLALGSDFDATNKASRSLLTRILKSCPALARLTLWSKHFCPTIDFLMGHIGLIPTLDQLKVVQMDIHAIFKLFRGKIHATSLRTLDPLAGVVAKEQEFLKRGLLTKVITKRVQEFTEDLWIEILRLNPNVSEIDIDCQGSSQALERIQLISAVRMKMVADVGHTSLRTLKLSSGSNPILSLEYVFSDENNNAVNMESAGTFVVTKLNTTNFERGHPADPLGSVLTRYGSMVERLVIDLPFKDSHASILDEVTKAQGSKLVAIEIEDLALTAEGGDKLGQIIERSPNLSRLQLYFAKLDVPENQDRAERILQQYAKRTTELAMLKLGDPEWVAKLLKAVPTRHNVPALVNLKLNLSSKDSMAPENLIQWITNMVMGPPSTATAANNADSEQNNDSTSTTALSRRTLNASLVVETSAGLAKPLTQELRPWVPLEKIFITNTKFQPQDWETILKAIDYTALEELDFADTNFDLDQLQLLIDVIQTIKKRASPLRLLKLQNTKFDAHGSHDVEVPKPMIQALRKKAPLVKFVKF